MGEDTGQDPGQGAGFRWDDYVAHLAAAHGGMTALCGARGERRRAGRCASIERALRRLRARGQRDGGEWGRRLLRAFGLPQAIEARAKWMGVYHSRFCDLPRSLCLDQLRLWDRPPVADSRARVWIQLGLASVALRARDFDAAGGHLRQAGAVPAVEAAARVELALAEAFLASRLGDRAGWRSVSRTRARCSSSRIGRARLLAGALDRPARLPAQPSGARSRARLEGRAGALRQHGAGDLLPFVSYRRDAGLAYCHFRLGDRERAIALAEAACRHAGDGGFLRLRVMALGLLARILGEAEGAAARERAVQIARRLEDEELLGRLTRSAASVPER